LRYCGVLAYLDIREGDAETVNLGDVLNLVRTTTKQHSPHILSVLSGAGVITTAILVHKASWQASREVALAEEQGGVSADPKQRFKENVRLVWRLYIPPAVSGASTIVCIAGANRTANGKTVAAQTALTASQQLLSNYREKVIEEFGDRKDQSIRDSIAEKRVGMDPPPAGIMVAAGKVMCCELFTGRYFSCDMETLRKAQNDLNQKLLAHDYCTMSDFYWMVGLPQTTGSSNLGWKSNRLLELQFSPVLDPSGSPCLAFEYNYTTTL
jgi:hypothetical protein